MGISQSKNSDTINWNNVKTNDFSSTLPNMMGISSEAKELINKLNLPELSENISSDIDNIFESKNKNIGFDLFLTVFACLFVNYSIVVLINKESIF